MKKLWVLGLIIMLGLANTAWAAEKLMGPKSLEGKSLEELYLMRNEIYARHGKPFKTNELHTYFMSQKWYKLDLKYKDSRLTKTDWTNIDNIKAKEQELLKHNYIVKDGQTRINFNNVINRRQFGKFSPQDIEKLSAYGFLAADPRTPELIAKTKTKKSPEEEFGAVGERYEQFFYLYDENSYRGVANFVTTDALLQLYHIFFDYTLRNMETEKLYPLLKTLTAEMLKHSQSLYKETKNPQLKEAARRNVVYFEVAQYFLTGSLSKLEPALAEIVRTEIYKCQRHAGMHNSLVFNPSDDPKLFRLVDYTQFVPRGHYTKSKELERYFMAMMWYGQNAFKVDNDLELLQGLIITRQLNTLSGRINRLKDLWEKIYEPTAFYVGVANELSPKDYDEIVFEVFGNLDAPSFSLKEFTDLKKLGQVKKLSVERFQQKQRVNVNLWGVPKEPQFKFMGQRFVPDSYILQRLSTFRQKPSDPHRPFPKGLDVMAVLGSKEAKKILLEEYKEGENWSEYPQRLEALMKEFRELHPDDWQQNLYYNWLWTLKSLIQQSKEFKYPFFMKNQAWERKSLSTAQASWAQLRHDTILYSQPSGAQAGDGEEWVPDPPKSFVEPNVVFYTRLGELLALTQEGLQKRELLTPKMKERFVKFKDLVSFLERAAVKELSGELLSNKEYEQIKAFGGWLESLTLSVITDDENIQWFELKSDADKNIAVIADVHTSLNQALEAGVGPAFEIYVIVEIGGQLKLTRGAVFSYYEFIHPASDRLTDAKWQQMIREGQEPPLPLWTKMYLADKPGTKLP